MKRGLASIPRGDGVCSEVCNMVALRIKGHSVLVFEDLRQKTDSEELSALQLAGTVLLLHSVNTDFGAPPARPSLPTSLPLSSSSNCSLYNLFWSEIVYSGVEFVGFRIYKLSHFLKGLWEILVL